MNPTNYKTTYYTRETELACFVPFPQYLLKLELSMTARVLYAQLLNRAKLSLQNGWVDERGRVYVYFSKAEIGQMLGKGRSAVQQALHDLNAADLIERERYAGRSGRRIYDRILTMTTPLFFGWENLRNAEKKQKMALMKTLIAEPERRNYENGHHLV